MSLVLLYFHHLPCLCYHMNLFVFYSNGFCTWLFNLSRALSLSLSGTRIGIGIAHCVSYFIIGWLVGWLGWLVVGK
jgi:hypothetical protein